MPRAESIERRLIATGKAAQSPIGTYRGELVAPTGDNLVCISLMPHIPHQFVVGRVEHIVEGKRQLHGAEARSKMSRVLRKSVDNILPYLDSQLLDVGYREGSKVFDSIDIV